jgi:hypothetical protein
MENIIYLYISAMKNTTNGMSTFIVYNFVYNTTPCLDSTESTPYFLTRGRHSKSFMDLDLEMPTDKYNLQASGVDYIHVPVRCLRN